MVRFCVEETNYVVLNNRIFKQTDGLTIGGLVSGILADFVVTDLLDIAVEKSGFDPTLLVKYVDDTLAFIPKDELENFLTILNGVNKSIRFTVKMEENNGIGYVTAEECAKSHHYTILPQTNVEEPITKLQICTSTDP